MWNLVSHQEHKFVYLRDEVAEAWGQLHNEVLHNLYSSRNIRMIESRKMSWEMYVMRMGIWEIVQNLVWILTVGDHLEDLGIDGDNIKMYLMK
jgi:hypothetical protein